MSRDARMTKLATIHIGRQRLGLDEDTYRSLIERISAQHGDPQRSAAGCTDRQLVAILRELGRLGFTAERSRKTRGKPRNFDSLPEYITKIEALLAEIRASWSYADAIARRMFGIERVAWCTQPKQLHAILAALDQERVKLQYVARIEQGARALGLTAEELVRAWHAPLNWRRNAQWLRSVKQPIDCLPTERVA